MITRDTANLHAVSAFAPIAALHSCTVSGFTSACGSNNMSAFGNGAISGYVIDRLALPTLYNSANIGVIGYGPIQASATSCRLQFVSVGIGVQHAACSTAGWTDFSTGQWLTCQVGYYVSTATSTADAWWNPGLGRAMGPMTCAATTSTSTGLVELRASQAFDLTGAERFIRVVVAPRIEATGCGGSYFFLNGHVNFDYGQVEPASLANMGHVLYSTANSTSTST